MEKSIHRTPKESHYARIDNCMLQDERLSYTTRGVLASILSRPDDWRITQAGIVSQGHQGRDAISTAMKEAVKYGYARKEDYRNSLGQSSSRWLIFESPALNDKFQPGDRNPATGKLGAGNPPLQTRENKRTETNPTSSHIPPASSGGDSDSSSEEVGGGDLPPEEDVRYRVTRVVDRFIAVTGKQKYREATIANVVRRAPDDPATLQRNVKGWKPVAESPICLYEFETKMEAHCAYIENHANVIWDEVAHGRRENGPDELCMQFHANLWATVIRKRLTETRSPQAAAFCSRAAFH